MPYALHALIRVPEVRAAAGYLKWRLLGITCMAATFSFKAFFDGIGKTHVHMVASVVMNVINVVLCIALIFGHWSLVAPGHDGRWRRGCGLVLGRSVDHGPWAGLSYYRINFRPFDLTCRARSDGRILHWSGCLAP